MWKEKERTNICVPTSKTVCLINQYTSDWLYVGELVEERLCLSCLPRVLLLLQFACAVVVVCPNKRVWSRVVEELWEGADADFAMFEVDGEKDCDITCEAFLSDGEDLC